MTGSLGFLRRQSLRVRITLSFVATAVLLTTVLAATTFFTVRELLDRSRVSSATRQTVFGVLFAREFLRQHPDRPRQLVSLLQSRERFDAMVTTRDEWFATRLSLTPAAVPDGLTEVVRAERLGYQYAEFEGERVLVFGGPLPPPRTDIYLFYSLEEVEATLSLIARVLAVVGVAVVAVAAIVAQRVSRRLLRPLAGVSTAAQRVAEGLLETRVEATSADEVGTLAASFNQMASALQEMIQRERRFVAAVSHELRTPLAALHTTSEILAERREALPPDAREAVDMVRDDVVALRRLVEELMEVSVLDSQGAAVRWEPVDLRALVRASLRRRRREAPVEGPAVLAYTDKGRVERILGNLIDNAFQHGGGAGVRVRLEETDGWCRVDVADRGPGISPEDLPHVFERFYKADRSRSRDRGGIGLGLAIASQTAILLGGRLEASNLEGGGALFSLRLPVHGTPEGEDA